MLRIWENIIMSYTIEHGAQVDLPNDNELLLISQITKQMWTYQMMMSYDSSPRSVMDLDPLNKGKLRLISQMVDLQNDDEL